MSDTRCETRRFAEAVEILESLDVGRLSFEALDNGRLSSLVATLPRVATKLDAGSMRAMAVWDARKLWKSDGARTGGAWLAGNTTMAASTAREKLRVAGSMGDMAETTEAFEAGEVSYTQVRQLQRVATDDDTKTAFRKREKQLVDRVKEGSAEDTGRLVDAWRHRHTPRAGVDEDNRRRAKRSVRTWKDRHTGMGHLHAELHPEAWAKIRNALQHLCDADWTGTHRNKANGTDATASVPRDDRTFTQRQADAFVSMADRALAILGKEADYRAPPVQMIVNVDYDTLLAKTGRAVELGSREPLCGEAARRLACDAGISRHITKGDSLILDKGRTTRTPTPAQRQAVWARDGGCTFPGCEAPVSWCRIHHTRPWVDNGDTDVWMLAAVCDFHHHLCHEGHWHVEADRHTGHQTWITPTGDRHRANQRGLGPEAEPAELALTA